MSRLPFDIDFHHFEKPGCRQLLALRKLRRGVEQRTARQRSPGGERVAVNRDELARELHELIAALDRRVPRVEQAGEASIASDAAALRAKAVKRLAELEGQDSPQASFGPGSPTSRKTSD